VPNRSGSRRFPWDAVDAAYVDAVRQTARIQLAEATANASQTGRDADVGAAGHTNHWPNACLASGLIAAHGSLHDDEDLAAVVAFADAIVDGEGAFREPFSSVSNAMIGFSLVDLFERTGDARYRKAAAAAVEFLTETHVKTPSGTLPYSTGQPSLVLVDTLAMVCPLLARYGNRFAAPAATELTLRQLREFLAQGVNARSGLPFQAFAIDGPQDLGMHGWTRGTGWLAVALVDTLAAFPRDDEARAELADTLLRLVEAVQPFQTDEGLWRWAVPAAGGILDTSGSAMIGYAVAKAVQLGVLDESHLAMAEQIAAGVARLTRPDGTVDKAQGECIDVGLYPATTAPAPWAQGPQTALASLVLAARRRAAARIDSAPGGPLIDADFPGGNILVERIDGDHVYLRPDPRDSAGNTFYWYFRVRRMAGRRLSFHLPGPDVVGARGAAVSTDGGRTWAWMNAGHEFAYRPPEDVDEVRFSVTMPYQDADLQSLLQRYNGHPHLSGAQLATTRTGRSVERLHLGNLDGSPSHRLLLSCRHHARESMASWTLEGIIEAVLDDGEDGEWFRREAELLVVPMIDKDGVEHGDPGKDRKPYDHNRDYLGESIYPEVAALKRFVPEWSEGRLCMALDLHCPELRGGAERPGSNEVIYFLGNPGEESIRRLDEFSTILEDAQTGPLRFDAKCNFPWGEGWNKGSKPRSCARWAETLPGVMLGTVLEVPFANAGGKPVTVESARAFGRDVARALRRFLMATCTEPQPAQSTST